MESGDWCADKDLCVAGMVARVVSMLAVWLLPVVTTCMHGRA